jgi:Predicted permeases
MEKFFLSSAKIFLWILTGIGLNLFIQSPKISEYVRSVFNLISQSIIYVIVPYFVMINLWKYGIKKELAIFIVGFFLVIMIITYFISKFLKKYNFSLQETYFPLTFMNTLYLGIPITQYFVSYDAVYFTLVYSIIVTIIQFTLGVFVISPNIRSIKFILTSPIIYAFVIGWILNSKVISIPQILLSTKDFLSYILSPIMLIFIGHSTPLKNFTKNFFSHIFLNIIRIFLVFILCVIYLIIIRKAIILEEKFLKTFILISVLPSAIINYIILENFGIDTKFVSGEILWGTITVLFLLPYISEFTEIILLILK